MNERILIIEDDQAILKLLQRGLAYEGYAVDVATDGRTGLNLARDHSPDLVLLDWMLPGMDGLEVCHRLRMGGSMPVLMLTAKDTIQDRVQGLDAGADDYLTKPFDSGELRARISVGMRMLEIQAVLAIKIQELRLALDQVKTLRGIVPICASCKKIRDDKGYWSQVEVYVRDHTEADFSHGICPDCMTKLYPEFSQQDKPVRPQ